jgi:hypothetical protein
MLSHTAIARPVLCCSPFLARQHERKKNGKKQGYMAASMRSLLQTVYAWQANRGSGRKSVQGRRVCPGDAPLGR